MEEVEKGGEEVDVDDEEEKRGGGRGMSGGREG